MRLWVGLLPHSTNLNDILYSLFLGSYLKLNDFYKKLFDVMLLVCYVGCEMLCVCCLQYRPYIPKKSTSIKNSTEKRENSFKIAVKAESRSEMDEESRLHETILKTKVLSIFY